MKNRSKYDFLWVFILNGKSRTIWCKMKQNKRRIEMADGFKLLDWCLSQQEQGMEMAWRWDLACWTDVSLKLDQMMDWSGFADEVLIESLNLMKDGTNWLTLSICVLSLFDLHKQTRLTKSIRQQRISLWILKTDILYKEQSLIKTE